MLHLTNENFDQEVLESKLPVIVDFWASWCRPCQTMSHIIEELETELEGKIKVVKVNVGEYTSIADRFNIKGIPTISLFVNGVISKEVVGLLGKEGILYKLGIKEGRVE